MLKKNAATQTSLMWIFAVFFDSKLNDLGVLTEMSKQYEHINLGKTCIEQANIHLIVTKTSRLIKNDNNW